MSFNLGYKDGDIIGDEWVELDRCRAAEQRLLDQASKSPLPGLTEQLDQVRTRINGAVKTIEQRYDKVCSMFPGCVQERRKQLAAEVATLFAECRRHRKWDDRSELKVGEHTGHIHELLLPVASYSQLVTARNGLKHYLAIHDQM